MILLSRIPVLAWRIIGAVVITALVVLIVLTSSAASTQPSGLIRVCSETPGQIWYQSIADNGVTSRTKVWNIAIGSRLFAGKEVYPNTDYWERPGSTTFKQIGSTEGSLCLLSG